MAMLIMLRDLTDGHIMGSTWGFIMSEERWFIEESLSDDFGNQWNLMLYEEGRLRCVAQYLEEQYAIQGLAAHKWLDSLGSGMMSLAMEGISINVNTGKVWKRPRNLKSFDLKVEKPKTRKPRS